MRIRFEQDMPASTVEVLDPSFQTVGRRAMLPDTETSVHVPSERSYLRVHLPSGRSLTLPRRDDLDYVIARDDLERNASYQRESPHGSAPPDLPTTVSDVMDYQAQRSVARKEGSSWLTDMYLSVDAAMAPQSISGFNVTWTPDVSARVSAEGNELSYSPPMRRAAYELKVGSDETTLVTSLPGSLESAYVRADDIGEGGTVITIRVASTSGFANTVGNYLAVGDYYSVETLAEWMEAAEEHLHRKTQDPFSAALGAYLLLRLERYDLMRTWTKNLADWFKDMSDGCVIWALQSLYQNDDVSQAGEYLLKAAGRGWPVYTEGTRLLSENLRRLGKEGQDALRQLEEGRGGIVWNSPFTATIEGRRQRDKRAISFDIGYEPIG